MWEQDERDPFSFNDAGNDPDGDPIISLRHAGLPAWYNLAGTAPRTAPGGAVVGHFDGHAELVKWYQCYDLIRSSCPHLGEPS
jgi:hypothetical protein